MKKQHIILIAVAAISIALGAIIAITVALMASPGSAQSEVETQAETQVEHEPEAEAISSSRLEDAEYVKSLSEQDQAYLLAIICLAVEDGNAPNEIAETIAETFDEISEDYAQRFVSATLVTVCNQASE